MLNLNIKLLIGTWIPNTKCEGSFISVLLSRYHGMFEHLKYLCVSLFVWLGFTCVAQWSIYIFSKKQWFGFLDVCSLGGSWSFLTHQKHTLQFQENDDALLYVVVLQVFIVFLSCLDVSCSEFFSLFFFQFCDEASRQHFL